MTIPFRYLDVKNHIEITNKLKYLLLNSLYLNLTRTSDFLFSFTTHRANQKTYDVHKHQNFWNFLDTKNTLEAIPELALALQELNITPTNFNLIVVNKGYGGLHSDAGSDTAPFRINWPVYNCDQFTKVFFYKLKTNKLVDINYAPPRAENSEIKIVTKTYDVNDIEHQLGYYVLTKPVLINYHIPHSVELSKNTQYPRVIMSIDFISDSLKL